MGCADLRRWCTIPNNGMGDCYRRGFARLRHRDVHCARKTTARQPEGHRTASRLDEFPGFWARMPSSRSSRSISTGSTRPHGSRDYGSRLGSAGTNFVKSQGKWGWLLFYVLMQALFVESAYEFAPSPHTVYRVMATAMSIIGLIFCFVKAWGCLRELYPR